MLLYMLIKHILHCKNTNNNLLIENIKIWANSYVENKRNLYDIDKYWLIFYELFKDNIINNPYETFNTEDKKAFAIMKKHNMTFLIN